MGSIGHGCLKAADGFGVLAPLLMNEAELILRFAIVGIHGGGFEHAAIVLAAAQAVAEAAEFAAQIIDQVEEEERRGKDAEEEAERAPEEGEAASGIQDSATMPAAAPLPTPKMVRTAKNIKTAK